MLTYKYIRIENGEMFFVYCPEGHENAPGIVAVSDDGIWRVVEESEEDFGKLYAHHAICGIDIARKSGVVAWY